MEAPVPERATALGFERGRDTLDGGRMIAQSPKRPAEPTAEESGSALPMKRLGQSILLGTRDVASDGALIVDGGVQAEPGFGKYDGRPNRDPVEESGERQGKCGERERVRTQTTQ